MTFSKEPLHKDTGHSISTLGSFIDQPGPNERGSRERGMGLPLTATERGGAPSLDLPTRTTATFDHAQRHRRRHDLWHLASDLVAESSLIWSDDSDFPNELVRLFRQYYGDVKDKVLVLTNEKDQAVILPYKTRVDPEYVREMRRKLRPLKKIRSDRAVMMTLTTDPSRWASLRHAHRGLLKNFHRLMTWLTKRYGSPLQYVVVPEFTKRGSPHLHVVVLGVSWLVSQAELSKMWFKYGQGKVVDIRRCGQGFRNSSVFHYVMKYVEKSWNIEDDSPSNLYHVASLWALNGRSFNTSRGLLEWKGRVKAGFVYLGCFMRRLVGVVIPGPLLWGRVSIDYHDLCAGLCV